MNQIFSGPISRSKLQFIKPILNVAGLCRQSEIYTVTNIIWPIIAYLQSLYKCREVGGEEMLMYVKTLF